ncbi:FUSC family protein [Lutibacter citreus]|uniref:FUSC family protein n=1 Tax=Lutibacter citreus TaxID=2138210 RepID=UPI000DBE95B5|nr:FUSC family protein [Lutibacter citreus]
MKEFTNLTNEELLKEKEKIQYNKMVNAIIIGFCVGIFIFSTVKNGFGFFTFLPLLLTYPFIKNGKKIKVLAEELKSRNL